MSSSYDSSTEDSSSSARSAAWSRARAPAPATPGGRSLLDSTESTEDFAASGGGHEAGPGRKTIGGGSGQLVGRTGSKDDAAFEWEDRLVDGETVVLASVPATDVTTVVGTSVDGLAYLTNFRLFFVPSSRNVPYVAEVPLGVVERVRPFVEEHANGKYWDGVELHCKDFRRLKLALQNKKDRKKRVVPGGLVDQLQRYCFPARKTLLFAYFHEEAVSEAPQGRFSIFDGAADDNGWNLFRMTDEYERFGLVPLPTDSGVQRVHEAESKARENESVHHASSHRPSIASSSASSDSSDDDSSSADESVSDDLSSSEDDGGSTSDGSTEASSDEESSDESSDASSSGDESDSYGSSAASSSADAVRRGRKPPMSPAEKQALFNNMLDGADGEDDLPLAWRYSFVNHDYGLCKSYPRCIVVPAAVSDDSVRQVAAFRSSGRVPVLSWVHPRTAAAMMRSSQPRVGKSGKRSAADEAMLRALAETGGPGGKLLIADCRPKANAVANKLKGGGTENVARYGGKTTTQLVFLDIENIHVVRKSYLAMRAICMNVALGADAKVHQLMEKKRGWLWHIRTILAGAVSVATSLEVAATSVLVHCSDGWDRTPQITCLVQLMLDPAYRTMKGFAVLIEKEWTTLGHQFDRRHGHGSAKYGDTQRSPVFHQFIDCTWQLLKQFPDQFEFNAEYLIAVTDNVYSCRFGTFLFDTIKQREEAHVFAYTPSLWTYLNKRSQRERFANADFHEDDAQVIFPQTSLFHLGFFSDYYMRFFASDTDKMAAVLTAAAAAEVAPAGK